MPKTTILIVEDEVIVAENIRSKLENLGYAVSEIVTSGKQAIQRLEDVTVDLILMDIELEGKMDGIEAAEHIREQHGIPIVYLTAYVDEKTLHRASLTEPFGYLLKPFQTRELQSNIEMALYKHNTEKLLKASEERYRRITASITDYVYIVRVKEDGQVAEVQHNAACVAVTGYTADEYQQNPHLWSQIVYPEDIEVMMKQTEQILLGDNVGSLEYRIIRKDGVIRWVRNTMVLHHDRQGKLISYDGLLQNISERKESALALEEERALLAQRVEERTSELKKANAELTRAARMKDEFLATMSHEFRTPLHTILGMAEALQEELFGTLNTKQHNALSSIEESGRHLLSLIKDILDLAKIGAGKFELHMTPVSVESVSQSSLRFIKQEALKKRLHVSFSHNSDITIIEADQRRLKQILVNLLSNAVKFTPEGGQVGLTIEGDHSQHIIHFIVWDTGIGIAKEDLKHLFQPFVQLDGTFTRKHSGTGLGLSLVARMVDMHGGSITVESEPGKGSRFIVSLSWKSTKATGPEKDGSTPQALENQEISSNVPRIKKQPNENVRPTVLIAEDQESNIEMLSEYLRLKGFHIIITRDGKEAIEQTWTEQPDIIIMDVQMPKMDGIEAIRQIRADESDINPVPIIAVTAFAMPDDREKCLAAGANEYLSKPVNLQRLVRIIRNLLHV